MRVRSLSLGARVIRRTAASNPADSMANAGARPTAQRAGPPSGRLGRRADHDRLRPRHRHLPDDGRHRPRAAARRADPAGLGAWAACSRWRARSPTPSWACMFPRAGGQYHYLKEAYGPLVGLPVRLDRFLVIMTGGIATLAVGFGEYLGFFLPVLLDQARALRAAARARHLDRERRTARGRPGHRVPHGRELRRASRRAPACRTRSRWSRSASIVGLAALRLAGPGAGARPTYTAPLPRRRPARRLRRGDDRGALELRRLVRLHARWPARCARPAAHDLPLRPDRRHRGRHGRCTCS